MPLRVDVFTCLPQLLEPVLAGSLLGKARASGVVDVRVHDLRDHTTDRHRSVDDTPFGGGPGMVLVPGVMGSVESGEDESFAAGLLEYPHYTRPADFRGWEVPEVLRSGDHGQVARWRRAQALARTCARRPDLVEARGGLSEDERA